MNQIEYFYNVFGFVALEVPDKMPRYGQGVQVVEFFPGFLDIVLSQDFDAGFHGLY